eukprot:5060310-Prymnesium_polylepis.1
MPYLGQRSISPQSGQPHTLHHYAHTPGRTATGYATPTDWNRSPDPACRTPCRTVTQPIVRSLYLSMRAARM